MSALAAVWEMPFLWGSDSPQVIAKAEVKTHLAKFRRYTEAILRKYVRLSMEAGRVPSLLGKEMFQGKVTSYRVRSFEDVVIFVHDVEKCVEELGKGQQLLIQRIALEEYTQSEAAELLCLSRRTVIREYGESLDELTRLFLGRQMLDPNICCQGADQEGAL